MLMLKIIFFKNNTNIILKYFFKKIFKKNYCYTHLSRIIDPILYFSGLYIYWDWSMGTTNPATMRSKQGKGLSNYQLMKSLYPQ